MAPEARTQVPPKQLEWLGRELTAWRDAGLIEDRQAAAIHARYEADTRNALARIAMLLGAAFLGVGVLWLVSANVELDELSPLARFLAVAATWLGFTVAGVASDRFGSPLRLIAALLFGATVFQAAQSLQVPAYEPWLVLAWSAGALALAYAARSVGPLVVGIATGVGWYVWALMTDAESLGAFVLGLGIATPVLAAIAVAHRGDRMGAPWLRIACVTGLGSLFLAALPNALAAEEYDLAKPAYAGLVVAILACTVAAWRAGPRGLPELAGAGALAAVCLLLVLFAPVDGELVFDVDEMSGGALLHAMLASAAYLLASAGVAAIGVARQLPGLVNLTAAALVLFVTLQSFGLFAPLLSGSVLFLIVGSLLVGTGLVVDRGRRRLHEEIAQ